MSYRYLTPDLVSGKTVLLRADLNEPLNEQGGLADDFRLRAILPTIRLLLAQEARVVVVAHLGRPTADDRAKLSLKPAAQKLAELLSLPFGVCADAPTTQPRITFCDNNLTDGASPEHIRAMATHGPVILENIRFYEGEEENSDAFAQQLAQLADLYVNDAFAACHRADASLVAITKYLPSYAGPLIQNEINNLTYITARPEHPFVLLMGGIKIADKAKTLQHLGQKADQILIGGGIANLLFTAEGFEIGQSEVDAKDVPLALDLINNFKTKIILPKDVVVQTAGQAMVRSLYEVKPSDKIMDLGPQTLLTFAGVIKKAKSICWNGPMGYFENPSFRAGTMGIAQLLGGMGKRKAFVVAGGGETVSAIRMAHQAEHIDHLSTGGGAMLEYLAGNTLPGLQVLLSK